MLVRNAIKKAIKFGMVPDVRQHVIEITNPRNGQKVSGRLVGDRTSGQWRVHGTEPDRPEFDEFHSYYVQSLQMALKMIDNR